VYCLDENNVYAGGVIAANVTPTMSDDFVSAAFLVNDNTLVVYIHCVQKKTPTHIFFHE